MRINPVHSLKGTVKVPGDKSISHRAVMLGSIAKGTTYIQDFLMGADCLSTIRCFSQMGISIQIEGKNVRVQGKGLRGLTKPKKVLDVGNSGTTMRLMSGILCGQDFETTLIGDASIMLRPMDRVITPLTMMHARIESLNHDGKAPIRIQPSELIPIAYTSPVASAQVKSAIMLASLYTHGVTTIEEPYTSRNHSELMMRHFGVSIDVKDTQVTLMPPQELYATQLLVPSDISSAAYFMVAGLITKHSEIIIKDVGINPTRDGVIRVLQRMQGNIQLENIRYLGGEKIADIIVKSSSLIGTTIEKDIIPTLIDEIPILAVAAAFALGQTIIKDAAELKVKESNRIDTLVTELKKMKVQIEGTSDGMIIQGSTKLKGATLESYHDHRIAMALSIAALNAEGETTLLNSECIDVSYPNFYEHLKSLI